MSKQLRTVPWYDRNAKAIVVEYNSIGVAAHSTTVRWTYTVPKGRMAFCEFLVAKIVVHTAATDDDYVMTGIDYKIKDGSWQTLIKSHIHLLDMLENQISVGQSMIMTEGDSIKGWTYNGTVDGVYIYCVSAKLTEFDAFPIEAPPFEVKLPKVDIQEPTVKSIVDQVVKEIKKFLG